MSELVVITGGTAGVGRATAERFARAGARLAILARGEDRLTAAQRELEQLGSPQVLAIRCDVANAEEVFAAADRIERELGPIDIWINVAFAGMMAPFIEISMEEFKRVTEVSYLGQIHGIHAALKRMIPRDRGAIVITGSALAYRGIPLQSPYCGSKHALQGFQDSLRCELLHMKSKVHVSMVQLPGVNTPEFDWMRTTMPMTLRPANAWKTRVYAVRCSSTVGACIRSRKRNSVRNRPTPSESALAAVSTSRSPAMLTRSCTGCPSPVRPGPETVAAAWRRCRWSIRD